MSPREKDMASLFDKLNSLVTKHGIEEILTALDDICFIRATNARLVRKDKELAKYWTRIGNRIKKIKAK